MKTLLIDNGSTLVKRLADLIPGEVDVKEWSKVDGVMKKSYKAIVLSGSSQFGVIEISNEISAEKNLVTNARVPVIGVCWGAELIAQMFGGELVEMSSPECGIVQAVVLDDALKVFGGRKNFPVYENHHWKIKSLPSDFIELARTNKSIAAFKHKSREIWGLQFHPETSHVDATYGDVVFRNLFRSAIDN